MTLDVLQSVQKQLEAQYLQLLSTMDKADKPVIAHTNCVELMGARQLIAQLITQEQIALCAPPGSTGPNL